MDIEKVLLGGGLLFGVILFFLMSSTIFSLIPDNVQYVNIVVILVPIAMGILGALLIRGGMN